MKCLDRERELLSVHSRPDSGYLDSSSAAGLVRQGHKANIIEHAKILRAFSLLNIVTNRSI